MPKVNYRIYPEYQEGVRVVATAPISWGLLFRNIGPEDEDSSQILIPKGTVGVIVLRMDNFNYDRPMLIVNWAGPDAPMDQAALDSWASDPEWFKLYEEKEKKL